MWSMSGLEIFVWEEKNMYELKTKPTNISPHNVIAAIPHPQKREDAGKLLEIFARATGQKPVVWGTKLIGYGTYRYQYPTGHRGEIYATGFSVSKRNITLHLYLEEPALKSYLNCLGKHTCGKSCLYINKLADVDLTVLEELVRRAWHFTPEI